MNRAGADFVCIRLLKTRRAGPLSLMTRAGSLVSGQDFAYWPALAVIALAPSSKYMSTLSPSIV